MAPRWKIALTILAGLVLFGILSFPALFRSVLRLKRAAATEERAQREIAQTSISTPTDVSQTAQLFWISASSPTALEATTVQLPLSADSTERAKQLLTALIVEAPTPAQRTLPVNAQLLALYLLPEDGTMIADFSEALSTETPSGILSEQLAVDSIVRTLGANMSDVHQLKILIHGQQTDTLAGHLDLTDFFSVDAARPVAPASPAAGTPPPSAASSSSPTGKPTPPAPAAGH